MADSEQIDPDASARASLLSGSRPTDPPTAPRAGRDEAAESARWVKWIALGSFLLVLLANASGIASGDDGVGYRAIADSILAGDGLGYFLEDPLTIWPPLWPALMALVARVTPLGTIGAAILLNAITAAVAVPVGYRLLRRVVPQDRLVLLGTAVIGLGGSTIGFGHLLMTDLAFAVVVMAWLLSLMNFHDSGARKWLFAAAGLIWLGFMLRYVSVYLIGLGGLWLLFDIRRRFGARLMSGITYGLAAIVLPVIWMFRNRAIDGTFTGERMPSARGPIDNGFDILGAMGRWVLPGVADGAKYFWAAVGGVVLLIAVWLGWRVLTAGGRSSQFDTPARRFLTWIGRPSGLLAVQAFGYLTYMLYVRSTTALNQLELRLLNPAYFSLIALALLLISQLGRIDGEAGRKWAARGSAVAHIWAVANVAVGLYAAVTFAAGDAFFLGNYESDRFVQVRANPALEALPEDCDVYSNLPNALYPAVGPQWSPRETGLESNEKVDDLPELIDSLETRAACLVWVDEQPEYGHLWSLDELGDALELQLLDQNDNVAVYRMELRA
ncbi:MAG: hypothetical protein GY812_12950 [Actinomycetia bacterium]|nr:hypothetical protein [Actinomycetes bacterium]